MQEPVASHRVAHYLLGVLRSSGVLLHGARGTAGSLDLFRDSLRALEIDVGQDDHDALPRERHGDRFAEPGPASRDTLPFSPVMPAPTMCFGAARVNADTQRSG